MNFIFLKTCLSLGTGPKFGPSRLCFDKETPKEGGPEKKKVNISMIGAEVSDEESAAALEKAKHLHAERKEVVGDTKAQLEALKAQLLQPPKPGEEKEKPKEEKQKPKELTEEEKKKLKEGPRIPERAKDALDGSQLMEAFRNCKSLEERQLLVLDQLAKGNVPDSYRTFQKIKVERNGKTLEFLAAPSGLRLGSDKDSIEFPMNGPLAQAVADATGCALPNKWMVDEMYEQGKKNGQFIPFAPQVFSKEDAARMRSADFIQTHDDKYKKWAADHNIDLTKPIFGYFKHVVQQSPEQRAKPHAGGNLDIYGGIYTNGNIVEPGGVGHDIYHDDYSQNVQLIAGTVYVDGKPMSLQDVLSDSDLAGTFGFQVLPKENKYQYSAVLAQRVQQIQQLAPGETGVQETKVAVFEGMSDDKLQKGKVTEEYDYTIVHGAPGGHVKLVKTDEGDIAVVEYEGQKKQVKLDLNNSTGVKPQDLTGYEPSSDNMFANRFGYAMLRYFGNHGAKPGDIIPFEYNGKQYIAQYQIHPPDSSAPTDHPGVGILMKSGGGPEIPVIPNQPSGVPNAQPVAMGLGPENQPVITGQAPPPRVKSGGGGMPAFGGGGSFGGGGAPSYAPSYSPSPTPGGGVTYSPPSAPNVPPTAPKIAPTETKEGGEYIIHGSTLFVGDSNTVGAFNRANINVDGEIDTVAEVGINAANLLKKMREYEATGKLDSMKNMVVTVGVNGIGAGADSIFAAIKEIWNIGKKHNIKVFAGTLAPFKGWENFGGSFEKYNEIRKEINRRIRASQASEGIPDAIIPYDELVADPNDPDKLAEKYEFSKTKPDHLHFNKAENAKIVASIVGERVKKSGDVEQKPEDKEGAGGVANFEKSPFFDERTKTYNFPEGDPEPLRVHINAPGNFDKKKPTRVVIFAIPMGNTIEQTIGAQKKDGQDWHFEIQQIGAQTRRLRETSPDENIVIAYVEAPNLNPVSWKKDKPEKGQIMGQLIDDLKSKLGTASVSVDISSHSAGRSLQFAYIDQVPQIPAEVKRLNFLDSGHSYNTARGEKIIAWLQASQDHVMTVISYDDRNVQLNGKPVPGAVGYAKTQEMIAQFQQMGIPLAQEQKNGFVRYTGLNGRVNILIMDNPDNKILHTETVFRNGFIFSETAGSPLEGKSGDFNGPLAFEKYVQPEASNLEISKEQPKAPVDAVPIDQVEYKVSGGVPGGVISFFPNNEAKMTYQDKEYSLKANPNYATPDLSKPPEGYQLYANPSHLAAVMDYAMLYTMLKMNKPQGTEMPFEYNGTKYLAKLAWHTDHPGADLYIQA